MKVVLAAGLYPPEIGGPATYARMLEEELPHHDIKVSAVPFANVRSYPKLFRHAGYTWKLWRATRDADIVYALDPVSVGVAACLVAWVRRLPLMVRLGGDYAWEQGRVRFGVTQTLDDFTQTPEHQPIPVRFLSFVQSAVTKRADRVVVPSNYLGTIVTTWGVAPERIHVIYSTLSPLQPDTDPATIRATYTLTSPVLVTAGRLVPWKGVAAVIEMVQNLRVTYPDATLVVVGDGPERPVLEAHVAKYGLHSAVRFVGQQDKQTLANLVAAADVFVLNTAYEGLSHQLIEVMDLEVPIVTTHVGGNPELVTDGQDALLVPYNNVRALLLACERIIGDRVYATQLTQQAKRRTYGFSRTHAVASIVTLLKQVYEQS